MRNNTGQRPPFHGYRRGNNGSYGGLPRGFGYQGQTVYISSSSPSHGPYNLGPNHHAAFNCYKRMHETSKFNPASTSQVVPLIKAVEDPS